MGGRGGGTKGQQFLHYLPLSVYHTSLSVLSYSIERTADTSFLCGKTPCQFNLVYNPIPSCLDLSYLLRDTIHARPLSGFLLDTSFSLFNSPLLFQTHDTGKKWYSIFVWAPLSPWRICWDHVPSVNRFFPRSPSSVRSRLSFKLGGLKQIFLLLTCQVNCDHLA